MEEQSRILIIEDDLDVAEMLEAYFNVQGYSVATANWGEDAVKAAQLHPPDLIILDIRLPDMDGYEVAQRLRSNRRTENIPIIFLTEKRTRADRLQGLELGADDYITKPFDIQELRLRVRNALQRSSQDVIHNSVTGFPEGALVDERLSECLLREDWAILSVSLTHLDIFRNAYGFIASDDVLRAVSLMIHNAVRNSGNTSDFVGHLTTTQFIVITNSDNLIELGNRISTRVEQSFDYFYPLKDRDAAKDQAQKLGLKFGTLLPKHGPFSAVEELKEKIIQYR